ncbi:hypothetical protein COY25_00405 [Candidatus Uhrbacteria bacterium CG_4_10_14_0_2_um_filter_41_7]|uniref:Uncharacterized protein n=1 Tax=Candidatus Uhrbacteria bacterium CG_4_9_14_3_um_filter_41_35 TaxID=1975034 RepID=A0A2M7XFW4_9BACT|nr:MAG: hypothetical protein COV92_00055 [Candidatus Uhrbacteria bacterium CG11_big_fil_rev_8_21_14_0_20_41_9]PIZ55691.1 MAG: hypothetical protein COY25_00405 [Candidatus Uhrbacteria bacterium CG_4_10_14_0_2_um_filter_41_7]PJA46764.1 MAG: hypothetical protein CO173_01580 [Candidatus Uhrbacteria bacterium CG_4_9_14_3_um_filter_41_35]
MIDNYLSFRLTSCSSCKKAFGKNSHKILVRTPDYEVIFAKCSGCNRTTKLNFALNPSETVCFATLTDLSFEDANNFLNNEAISIDDVIQVHKALKFDNFSRIG